MVPVKLGLPYTSLNVVSGIIAVLGVSVLLVHSKFPTIAKILLPFSFFTFYQYAVVARSYVLIPLLLFLTAIVYRYKTKRIYLFLVLLCLLANANLHGLLIAISLMLVHLVDLRKQWCDLDKSNKTAHIVAICTFSTMMFLLIFQLMPPEDAVYARGCTLDPYRFLGVSAVMLCNSTSELPFISIPVLMISCLWFRHHKVLLVYLVPTIFLLLFFSVKIVKVWHEGILFFVWIFAAWIGFENRNDQKRTDNKSLDSIEKMFVVSLVLVLSVHLYWSFNSFKYDFKNNYSASRDIADYIKQNNLEDVTIYVTSFHSISILPYFKDNIFNNHNNKMKPSFWWWSTKNEMIAEPKWCYGNTPKNISRIVRNKPEIVIWGVKFPHQEKLPALADYEIVATFDGAIYWKNRIYERDTFVLLRMPDHF
jgi:hypothetical protein